MRTRGIEFKQHPDAKREHCSLDSKLRLAMLDELDKTIPQDIDWYPVWVIGKDAINNATDSVRDTLMIIFESAPIDLRKIFENSTVDGVEMRRRGWESISTAEYVYRVFSVYSDRLGNTMCQIAATSRQFSTKVIPVFDFRKFKVVENV